MPSTPLICCSIGATTVSADGFGARAGKLAVHGDDRRRDFRILRDRQPQERDRRQGSRRRSDTTAAKIGRSMKKCEIFMRRLTSAPRSAGAAAGGGEPCACGVTFAPGRARIIPLTITRSSGMRPSLITRKWSLSWPSDDEISATRCCRRRPHRRTCGPVRCRSRRPAPATPRRAATPAPARAQTCRA